jgi:hypothetical protein
MAVGDFNNDGKMDVVVFASTLGAQPQSYVQTYLGKGDGTFAGDVNRDGNLDLVGPNVVALGVGDGTFQPPVLSNPAKCDHRRSVKREHFGIRRLRTYNERKSNVLWVSSKSPPKKGTLRASFDARPS